MTEWKVEHFQDRGAPPLVLPLTVTPEPEVDAPLCTLPWRQFVVRPDRSVVPCTFWYTTDRMGNLEQQTFAEIWDGPAYRALRAELLAHRPGVNCRTCPIRGIGSVDDERAHYSHGREKGRLASHATDAGVGERP